MILLVRYISDSSSSVVAFILPQLNNCRKIEIHEIYAGGWTNFPHFLGQSNLIHWLKLGFAAYPLRQMPGMLWIDHDFHSLIQRLSFRPSILHRLRSVFTFMSSKNPGSSGKNRSTSTDYLKVPPSPLHRSASGSSLAKSYSASEYVFIILIDRLPVPHATIPDLWL